MDTERGERDGARKGRRVEGREKREGKEDHEEIERKKGWREKKEMKG